MMKATYLIGKHLPLADGSPLHNPCVLCGAEPDGSLRALPSKEVIPDSFTDCDYLRPGTEICVYCAACLGYGQSRTEWVKNHSCLATPDRLTTLKREHLWDALVEHPCEDQFVFCATYSHKKHTSFKARVNLPGERPFSVQTENNRVDVWPEQVSELTEIIQGWYTVCADTAAEPTWFSKADILGGCRNYKRIDTYGWNKYLREDAVIRPYRSTALLELLCHALNKKKGAGDD